MTQSGRHDAISSGCVNSKIKWLPVRTAVTLPSCTTVSYRVRNCDAVAGWIPSVLTLIVSYTILRDTLESRILRDRQTLVQLLGHVVGTDLSRSSALINYYETLPEVARILSSPNPAVVAQQWLNTAFYSHPNIDGMFLAGADGALLASIPTAPDMVL